MKHLSLYIFLIVMLIFGTAVTAKYAWEDVEYLSPNRYAMLEIRRPFFGMIMRMNADRSITRDTTVFQSGFYEYRAWCDFNLVGRRMWDNSWQGYTELYPENTPSNLHTWLTEDVGADYIWVKDGNEFELPLDNLRWVRYFYSAVDYTAWNGEHTVIYGIKETDDE